MAFYGESFGGIQQARTNDQQMRAAQSQAVMAQLYRALEQRQAQQNFQQQMAERAAQTQQDQAYRAAQLQMQRQQAIEAAKQHEAAQINQDRNFQLNRDYFDWQKQQPTKQDATAEKDLASDLRFRVENRLPYNPEDYAKLPEPVRAPLMSYDMATRQEEAAALEKAKEAALAGRRIRIIQQRADELSKQPREGMFRPDLGNPAWAQQPSQNPPQVSREMMDRLGPLRMRYAPLLDPKAKLVAVDPSTGDFIPHPELIKPWMAGAGAGARPKADQGTEQGDTSEARPIEPTRTGTLPPPRNLPPSIFKGQAQTIDIVLPDGRVVTGPATNAAALLKRFPGAQMLINN